MRKFLACASVLTALLSIATAGAEQTRAHLNCNGAARVPTTFVSGRCNDGDCHAFVPGTSISSSGTCSSGVVFQASGFNMGGYVVGRCQGNIFTATLPFFQVSLHGSCSNGGHFNGHLNVVPG